MNKKTVDWLLEESEPAVRYRTLIWLLDSQETDREVRKAKERITEDPSVRKIFSMQDEDGGFYGNGRLDPLVALADFGYKDADKRILKSMELISSRQTLDGGFKSYYGKKIPCGHAEALGLLIALGENGAERIEKGIEHLLSIQRLDGGWLHGVNTLPGGKKEGVPSCPHATLHALWVLSFNKERSSSKSAERAFEFVLRHWETKLPIPEQPGMGFGIGSRFSNLKYPLVGYHILAYASILSRFPGARKDKRMKDVARTILDRRDAEGLFKAESVIKAFSDFEFGRKNQPSKWITLHSLRIIKQVLGKEHL